MKMFVKDNLEIDGVLVSENEYITSWSEIKVYNENDIVVYNGKMYRSKIDNNEGNDPEYIAHLDKWENMSFEIIDGGTF